MNIQLSVVDRYGALAGLCLLMSIAVAQARTSQDASFDCRRAASVTERMICATPQLSTLDRQIGARYASLLQQFDPVSAKALVANQRAFIQTRDATVSSQPTELESALRERLTLLNAITPGRATIIGTWGNSFSKIWIERLRSGALSYRVNAVDPVAARWVCDASGLLTEAGRSRWNGTVPDRPDQTLSIRRQRDSVIINDAQTDHGYCGLNGSISGSYFPVTE